MIVDSPSAKVCRGQVRSTGVHCTLESFVSFDVMSLRVSFSLQLALGIVAFGKHDLLYLSSMVC